MKKVKSVKFKKPNTRRIITDDKRILRRSIDRVEELQIDGEPYEKWDGAIFVHGPRCPGYCDYSCGNGFEATAYPKPTAATRGKGKR